MKTKEEILAKYFHKNILSDNNKNVILEAMEEYAAEASIDIAIDFASWLENHFTKEMILNIAPNTLSKEQLFDIFLDDLHKEELLSYVKGE